jgi:hypothetical protein
MQVVGSIAIAPLMKRASASLRLPLTCRRRHWLYHPTGFPTRSVLSSAIIVFGCVVTLFLIIDAATGGKIKATTSNGKVKYGTWAPDALFPLYAISGKSRLDRYSLENHRWWKEHPRTKGIAYGMVELIRRVIPREWVTLPCIVPLSTPA